MVKIPRPQTAGMPPYNYCSQSSRSRLVGSEDRVRPFLLPGTQPLKPQSPRRQTLDSKDTRSPPPQALESPIFHPERLFRCRLFVLTKSRRPSALKSQRPFTRRPAHLRRSRRPVADPRPPPRLLSSSALPPPRPRPHALPIAPPLPRPLQPSPPPRPRRRRPPPSPARSPPTAATALTMKSRRTPESPNPD